MRSKNAVGAAALVALALLSSPLVAQAPLTLKFMELGRGPTIVFVHDLGGARLQWMPTARKLIGDHHVVLADLPGHGETALPDPFSYEACAAALDQVLAKQKPESTIVVAQGLGGAIALIEAKAHPERLRGLIVIDTGLKGPPIPDQQKQMFIQFVDQNYDMFLKSTFARMGRDSAEGVAIHARAALVPQASMKTYFRTVLNLDATSAPKGLKVPLLFVGSARGWPDTTSWATIGHNRGFEDPASIPARRIANSGMQVYADQPDTLALVIRDFEKQAMTKK